MMTLIEHTHHWKTRAAVFIPPKSPDTATSPFPCSSKASVSIGFALNALQPAHPRVPRALLSTFLFYWSLWAAGFTTSHTNVVCVGAPSAMLCTFLVPVIWFLEICPNLLTVLSHFQFTTLFAAIWPPSQSLFHPKHSAGLALALVTSDCPAVNLKDTFQLTATWFLLCRFLVSISLSPDYELLFLTLPLGATLSGLET